MEFEDDIDESGELECDVVDEKRGVGRWLLGVGALEAQRRERSGCCSKRVCLVGANMACDLN